MILYHRCRQAEASRLQARNPRREDREPRIGRNPHTKESIEIPATRVPVFKPSKALRDIIAK